VQKLTNVAHTCWDNECEYWVIKKPDNTPLKLMYECREYLIN